MTSETSRSTAGVHEPHLLPICYHAARLLLSCRTLESFVMWIFVIKFIFGGSMVVAFALISEAIRPHTIAGIFSASPSIAMAGLTIAFLTMGPSSVEQEAIGMAIGAVAMLVYVCFAWLAVKRTSSLLGSVATLGLWIVVAGIGYSIIQSATA